MARTSDTAHSAPGPSLTARKRAEVTAANVRGVSGPVLPGLHTTARRHHVSRTVDDQRPAGLPAFSRRRIIPDGDPPVPVAGKLDDQQRVTAKKQICGPLGWDPDTELVAYVDGHRRLVWVQPARVAVPHDTDGSPCECGRCVDETTAPPPLPGEPTRSTEPVSITGKWELSLTEGLCTGAGIRTPGPVGGYTVPALHALVLVAPADGFDALLASRFDAEPASDIGDNVTDINRKDTA